MRTPHTRTVVLLAVIAGIAILGYETGKVRAPKGEPLDRPLSISPDTKGTQIPESLPITGIVVPHHDLVQEYRSQFFRSLTERLAGVQPKTIILVSPNHRSSGTGLIQTSSESWQAGSVSYAPPSDLLSAVLKAGVRDEPASLRDEDGIRLILKDIATHFPEANLLPLTLKENVPLDTLEALEESLRSTCQSCLMVASVDFSHYQPYLLAELHDSLTLRLLFNRDVEGLLKKSEVDSPSTLAFLALWAQNRSYPRFNVSRQTNSGILANNPDVETTSHVFGWYEQGEEAPAPKEVSFLIGGDMMFGRMIAHTFPGNKLATVGNQLGNRLFWGTDAGIINLEGPVSPVPVPDDIRSNNLVFNFPPETIDALKYIRVNAVSLANNHTSNAGSKGLASTLESLDSAGIAAIGGPGDTGITQIGSFEGSGLTLKVIGVHLLSSQPDLTALIKELASDPKNRIILMPHWGNEYQEHHNRYQENLAHSWIDAGASAVVGSHPHVVQDAETYAGKPIIYSLGNLLFDQTFSQETQEGLLIAGRFSENGYEIFALPTGMKKYQPLLLTGTNKTRVLGKLYEGLGMNKEKDPRTWRLVFPQTAE